MPILGQRIPVEPKPKSPSSERKNGTGKSYAERALQYGLSQYKASKNKKKKKEDEVAKKKARKVRNDFSQNYIPVKEVEYGIIHTTDGRWVKIMEIQPVNFYEKSSKERNKIVSNFTDLFRICPRLLQIKVTSDRANPHEIIDNVLMRADKNDPVEIVQQRNDYVKKIKNISSNASISKRFFLIFQYEGKSRDPMVVADDMLSVARGISNVLASYGNFEILRTNDYNYNTMSTLYYLFNRKSVRVTPYEYRYKRMIADTARYNEAASTNKKVSDIDLISPRGINTYSKTSILMDGQYITWLTLKEEGHPDRVYAGWLDCFSFGEYVDIDVYIKRLPRESTRNILEQYNVNKRASAREHSGNAAKFEQIMGDVNNNTYVASKMNADEDLMEVTIVLTIRADSIKSLNRRKNTVMKSLQARRFYVEDTFLNTENYLKMTMPLLFIDHDIFGRNKRNYLTSSLSGLYPFTSPELYDPTGFMVGINKKNGTIAAINNFNTQFYKNANMAIFGTSGSGKTFTEQVLGYGMLFAGIRVFYILPVKGYEYIPGCLNVKGSYFSLGPGFKSCINLMEIRPETQIDTSTLGADIAIPKVSLLAKKTTSIITAIQLLMFKETMTMVEQNKLNAAIVRVYNRYGITDDNSSIFEENGIVKKMPITDDLYKEVRSMEGMERILSALDIIVNGTCSNMNAQTNIDLSNNYTVIDVDEEVIGESLLPFFLYIAFDCVNDMVKSSRTHFDAVFLDEVWKMMANEEAAKQVQKMVKLIRGYAGSVITATQDIFDFLNNDFGVAVLNNTEIKLFLNMKDDECERVAKIQKLSEEDQKMIHGFNRGEGMLISNGDKVCVNIIASEHEVYTFTTDANILRKKQANTVP